MSKVEDLKKENEQRVRECLYDGRLWTKVELARESGISLAAITNILQSFQDNNEIKYMGEQVSTGGRKAKLYQLNPNYYYILKIALKRNKDKYEMLARVVDLFNEELYVQLLDSKEGSVTILLDLITNIRNHYLDIGAVCLSIPGICQDGIMDVCDFDDFIGKDIKQMIQTEHALDVIIENDVNVACIGFSIYHPTCKHIAFVYQPNINYVGSGIMIDRKLYNGFSHFAGELRYLPFYNTSLQDQMLREDPKKLLTWQIESLCSVINPEVVGIHSDALQIPYHIELTNIPGKHQPQVVEVEHFDDLVMSGLYYIGLKKMKERRGLQYVM